LLIDLPSIADTFAEQFEQLPTMYRDREDYRFLVTTGRLVAAAVVRRPTRGRRVDRLVQRRDRPSLTRLLAATGVAQPGDRGPDVGV
jgi:hypothetical protein